MFDCKGMININVTITTGEEQEKTMLTDARTAVAVPFRRLMKPYGTPLLYD
jgi:hypothetical protein